MYYIKYNFNSQGTNILSYTKYDENIDIIVNNSNVALVSSLVPYKEGEKIYFKNNHILHRKITNGIENCWEIFFTDKKNIDFFNIPISLKSILWKTFSEFEILDEKKINKRKSKLNNVSINLIYE